MPPSTVDTQTAVAQYCRNTKRSAPGTVDTQNPVAPNTLDTQNAVVASTVDTQNAVAPSTVDTQNTLL